MEKTIEERRLQKSRVRTFSRAQVLRGRYWGTEERAVLKEREVVRKRKSQKKIRRLCVRGRSKKSKSYKKFFEELGTDYDRRGREGLSRSQKEEEGNTPETTSGCRIPWRMKFIRDTVYIRGARHQKTHKGRRGKVYNPGA